MAAENLDAMGGTWYGASRFKEAAANGRGKLPGPDPRRGGSLASMRPRRMAAENGGSIWAAHANRHASMRPRRMAAENISTDRDDRRLVAGFNEAAANGRGKRTMPPEASAGMAGFNEAAANGRGKRRCHIGT